MIKIFDKNDKAEFAKAVDIRRTVFVDEQGAENTACTDGDDASDSTRFVLVCRDGEAVGTGRIIKLGSTYKIGRVAVLESERGKGTGKIIIETLCKEAKRLGAAEITVNAQLHAVPFYEKLGFKPTGEKEVCEIGIIHLPMRKE